LKQDHLDQMINGWFVGAFEPTAFSTDACEVAVKYYQAGDHEDAHYHKVATETTLVLSGQVSMLDRVWFNGDIITISPGEITAFKALTDAVTVVVKVPGKLNDKFLV
tara:strand:- start:2536 stop:2856 length:321 start_codon:yes stop_codon:yes gene_type:complete